MEVKCRDCRGNSLTMLIEDRIMEKRQIEPHRGNSSTSDVIRLAMVLRRLHPSPFLPSAPYKSPCPDARLCLAPIRVRAEYAPLSPSEGRASSLFLLRCCFPPHLGQCCFIPLAQRRLFKEIRPPFQCPFKRFVPPPLPYPSVVTRQKNLRDTSALKDPRSCIMGIFEETILKRILPVGPLPPEETRKKSGHCIYDNHRR